jgi:DNA-binding beta-propeller fold protein YncE
MNFPAKKPFQLYQELFTDFLNTFAKDAHGPLALTLSVQDLNGHIYVANCGTSSAIENLLENAKLVLKESDNVTISN